MVFTAAIRDLLAGFSFPRSSMRRLFLLTLTACLLAQCRINGEEVADLFGPTPPVRYLTGRFAPEKHPAFVSLERYGIPTRGRKILVRQETAEALQALQRALKKDHPKMPFLVISGTRNWYSQKGIWERKWTGRTLVGGKRLNRSIPDPARRAKKILEYSSMPGTSRHHWGSDVDINSLTNSYFKKGQGRVLYAWLRKNAGRFGFCQPYTAGRTAGYQEERWHWSYLPLSRPLLSEWRAQIKADRASLMGRFAGSAASTSMAPVYVESINPDCK